MRGQRRSPPGCLAAWLLLVALVCRSAELPVRQRPGARNLITNGGFEESTAGWQPDPKHELLTDPKAAHTGNACLTGEIAGPNQHLRLLRSVPVSARNRYDFEIWAKATNKTKLVLWIVPPGGKESDRRLVEAWEDLPGPWQRCTAQFTVPQDGELQLQLIAPSSHNAPPGRIWVDDIALVETELPVVTSVSQGQGFNDEGALAAAGDGSLYVAWNSFREDADSLQLARYQVAGNGFKELGRWQALTGTGPWLLGLKLVAAGDTVYAVYAAELKENWDIYALPCTAAGPGQPIRLTTAAAAEVKPAAAWADGTLWVAWETNPDGWRQIMAASLRAGVVSRPEAVSGATSSNYDASLAVLPGGELVVAWHSFRENNFDVYARRRRADGSWEAELRLTRAPSIDRHPLLVARGPDLWVIYENALMGNRPGDEGIRKPNSYGVGATLVRRLVLARLSATGLEAPARYAETSPVFQQRAEAPSAQFDSAGRLWLACRTLGVPVGAKARPRAWNVSLTCFDGQEWSEPTVVSHQAGMDRYPGLALLRDRAVLAYESESTPILYDDEAKSRSAASDIHLALVPCPPSATSRAPVLTPQVEPREPFSPGEIRVERGEDRPTSAITYRGQRFNLYFGNLHDHTDISQCNRTGDESVDESYANMRDITRCDFACATDHGYNLNPYLWGYLAKMARTNDDPGRFLTFLAEEWTSSFEEYDAKHPYGFYGHRNLILADTRFPRWWNARNRQTPAQVWEDLRRLKANFVQIPHQLADTGNVPTDWDFTDETAQPVAEIFQCRGSYEYKGTPREAAATTPAGYFLQDAWARGIVIGVIASPDHGGGTGKACVYAPELTREAILDGLRARHCYGTTAAKIALDVRVNGYLMGEKVPAAGGKPVEVAIRVDCPAEIDRIEVCRNNEFVYSKSPEAKTAEVTFVDAQPLAGRSYYYVRVIQKDGEIAWSSPVWLAAE